MRFSVLPHKDNTFSPNSPKPHPKTHNTNNSQKPQKSTLFSIIYPPHNRQHHNVGTCLRHVSLQSANVNASPNMPRHVPTLWRYRFGEFDSVFYQEIILSSGGEWIEVRFMVLISGFNIWWGITCLVAKLIAEEEKCKFTRP